MREALNNWDKIKLKEICDFINGDAYKDTDWSSKGIPIVRIQNLNNENKPFNYWSGSLKNKITIDNGDLLLAWSGTPGTSFGAHIWNRGFALLNQHIFKVIYDGKRANPFWLKYAINQVLDIMIERSHGAVGLRHVTKSDVENLEILLPPIYEQERLIKTIETKLNAVEIVNKANNEQIKLFQLLKEKLYDEIFKKYINDQVTIDSICDDISDGTHFTPAYIDQGIPFLSVKDLTRGFISFDDCRYIAAEEHKKLIKRCNPQYGDVLYTKVGTTGIAKAIDVKTEFSIFVSVALLKLKKDISPIFIEKALNLPFCRKQAEKLTQGATNKNLVIKDLKKIKLFCPDYSEQQKIVSTLENIDDKLNLLNKSFKEQSSYIGVLSSSILRTVFNGDY
jgi:type I restriction enzyme S subunit